MLHITTEEIESLDAPGFWSWAAGVVAGAVVGTGVVIGVTLT